MPKLIFTSQYLRDAPSAQIKNYVRYIGTREGVEKIDESKLGLPATQNQKQLIRELIRDIPQTKDLLEYTDFLLQPTIGNATEFLTCALEQNLNLIGKRENYVDYIANRPRVERVGAHGLFTDAGVPLVLSHVQEEVATHKGAVWTHVVSLRREDAARLGYDSAGQWMALLRSKRAMLCKHMKIDSENLRWYAAFHNESHHPHVHLMIYSAKDSRVAELYEQWGKWQNEILLTYRKEMSPLPPLSRQPQFKSIRNMIIAEALKLGNHIVTFEDEQMAEAIENTGTEGLERGSAGAEKAAAED